jgi:LPS-assembly protein
MKDESAKDRGIDVSNIFNIDRMNIGDSFEPGKSLTLGIDYKKENINEINKYFELKLGTIFRESNEDRIPKSSTINRTTSNLFGSIENSFGEHLNLKYDFSLDNDFNTFDYNSIEANLKLENFETSFIFSEENGERGDGNVWSNETSFNIDETHYLTFGTRRNRKISLTEYYDLVYDYRNDCLKAGFKYKKTYYEDRDIKPKEDLLFTITITPLTTYEYKVDQELYRSGENSIDDQIKRLFN